MTGLLSPAHIVVLLIVLLLVFGAKRLPELGRSLGSGMREFKHSIGTDPTEQPASPAALPASDEPDAVLSRAGAEPTTSRVDSEPTASRPAA